MQGHTFNRPFRPTNLSRIQKGRRSKASLVPLLLAVSASSILSVATGQAVAAASSANTIGGEVFRDTNDDGVFGKLAEEGVAGVEVQAFAANGQQVGLGSTDASGKFSISSASPLPWRLEYARIPAGLEPGRRTKSGGTIVQFAPVVGQDYDLALIRPGEVCQTDPQIAATCFVLGDVKGEFAPEQTLVRFASSATGKVSDPATEKAVVVARHKDMGATYGLAWQASSGSLFSSAYVKRFSGLGSGGIGSIYRNGMLAVDLTKLKGASSFGSDPHPTDPKLWSRDSATFTVVGKIGLGDLDISLDGRQLFTVNMAEKQLVAIPVSRGGSVTASSAANVDQAPAANQVGQFRIPSPCATGSWRPMGIAVQSTRVLVGGTCPDELRAVVLGFALDSRTWSTPLLSFELDFARGAKGFERMWEGWPDDETRVWNRPQLMVSDLSIDGADLIVGLRDRYGDQTGLLGLPADPAFSEPYSAGSLGEVVRACSETGSFGETGGWVLESNGSCGGRSTDGKGNSDGPGGGEFYFEDDFYSLGKISPDTPHSNGFEGALAALPANDRVVATLTDPLDYFSTGVTVMGNRSGKRTHSYEISLKGSPGGFGKANGIGDIEALCDEGAIELGDRIWFDSNANGIQDANEPGVANVVIELVGPDGTVMATATTDPSGSFLFSNGKGSSTTSERRGIALEPNTSGYTLRVKSGQSVLEGATATLKQADGSTGGAFRDSNASASASGFVIQDIKTGLPGTSLHTLDIGLIPGPKSVLSDSVLRPRATVTAPSPVVNTRVAQLAPPREGTASPSVPKVTGAVQPPLIQSSPSSIVSATTVSIGGEAVTPKTSAPISTAVIKSSALSISTRATVQRPSATTYVATTTTNATATTNATTTTKRPRDEFRAAGPAIPKRQTTPNFLTMVEERESSRAGSSVAIVGGSSGRSKAQTLSSSRDSFAGPDRPALMALTGSNLTGLLIRIGFVSLGFGFALIVISRRKPSPEVLPSKR